MARQRTFRLFVSSTFSDLVAERNALQHRVFPRLKARCVARGTRFQAIDLRWGIRQEASLDHQTLKICLDEIARCQRATPRPNFLVLLGNRYGWRPLPSQIAAPVWNTFRAEFERRGSSAAADYERLSSWYDLDANGSPAPGVYQLKARRGRYVDPTVWSEEVEVPLTRLLDEMVDFMPADSPARRLTMSATEHEILRGALNASSADSSVFAFFRTLAGVPADRAAQFLNMTSAGARDEAADHRVDALKNELRRTLPRPHVREYETAWPIDQSYLDELCADVERVLSDSIVSALDGDPAPPTAIEREIDEHRALSDSLTRFFVGRDRPLERIDGYLRNTATGALLVAAESGSGKSALLARAAGRAREGRPAVVIERYIGRTPNSTSTRELLLSISEEMALAYGRPSPAYGEYGAVTNQFAQLLALATEQQPLVIVLDALDQLQAQDLGRGMGWLPPALPEHARLVLSVDVQAEDLAATLRQRIAAENVLLIDAMTVEEADHVLSLWLADAGRRLVGSPQSNQRQYLLDQFRSCPRPLYLKLAFDTARHWRSFDPPSSTVLAPDIPTLVERSFERLASPAEYGETLVSRVLGYLAAARYGLTEDELLDVLSRDEACLAEARRFHDLPEQRLPVSIWARLHGDLEPYMAERLTDGVPTLGFQHRYIESIARSRYLESQAAECHAMLARVFGEQPSLLGESRLPNARKARELHFQLMRAADTRAALVETLTDIELVAAKCAVGMTFDLLAEYRDTLTAHPDSDTTTALAPWARFLSVEAHALQSADGAPLFALQHACNMNGDSVVQRAASRALATLRDGQVWLRCLNRVAEPPDRALLIIQAHESMLFGALAFSPDGRRLVSVGGDRTLRVWDTTTGALFATRVVHNRHIACCAWAANAPRLVSADGAGVIAIWDTETWMPVRIIASMLDAGSAALTCAITADGLRVATSHWDNRVRVWNVESGREEHSLALSAEANAAIVGCGFSADGGSVWACRGGRTLKRWTLADIDRVETISLGSPDLYGFYFPCAATPDGRYLAVSGDEGRMRSIRVWDLSQRETRAIVSGHTKRIATCAISRDGRLLATGSEDSTLRLWEIESGTETAVLFGHSSEISAIAIAPDGRTVASASWDGAIRLWSTAANEPEANTLEHAAVVSSCAFVPQGDRLLSSSDDVVLWNRDASARLLAINGHTRRVSQCHYRPHRNVIVSASGDRTVAAWDAESGRLRHRMHGHGLMVRRLSCTRGGDYAITHTVGESVAEPGRLVRRAFAPDRSANDVRFTVDFDVLAITPDGTRLLSTPSPSLPHTRGFLVVASIPDGAIESTFTQQETSPAAGCFSTSGEFVASCCSTTLSGDKETRVGRDVYVWEASTAQTHAVLRTDTSPKTLAWSVDDRWLLVGGHDAVELWDWRANECVSRTRGLAAWIRQIAFTPDGRHVAIAVDDYIYVHTVPDLGRVQSLDGDSFALSPDGRYLAVAGTRGGLTIQRFDDRTVVASTDASGRLFNTSWSPDGATVVSSLDDVLTLWNWQTGTTRQWLDHRTPVSWCAFTPDGASLISVSFNREIHGFRAIEKLNAGTKTTSEVAVWKLTSGIPIMLERRATSMAPQLSPSGEEVLWATSHDVRFARVKDGAMTRRWPRTGPPGRCDIAVFARDGRALCMHEHDGPLRIVRVDSGETLARSPLTIQRVEGCTVSPDGRIFALSLNHWINNTRQSPVALWRPWTNAFQELWWPTSHGVTSLVFSGDGSLLVGASSEVGRFVVWDVASGRTLAHVAVPDPIWSLDCHPDGRMVTGDFVGRLRVWQLENHRSGAAWTTCWRAEDGTDAIDCRWCGTSWALGDDALAVVQTCDASHATPSLGLPDEAFTDPRLTTACPACGHAVRITPFMAASQAAQPSAPANLHDDTDALEPELLRLHGGYCVLCAEHGETLRALGDGRFVHPTCVMSIGDDEGVDEICIVCFEQPNQPGFSTPAGFACGTCVERLRRSAATPSRAPFSATAMERGLAKALAQLGAEVDALVGSGTSSSKISARRAGAFGVLLAQCELAIEKLIEGNHLVEALRATDALADLEWRAGFTDVDSAKQLRRELRTLFGAMPPQKPPTTARVAGYLTRIEKAVGAATQAEEADRPIRALSLWHQAAEAAATIGDVTAMFEARTRQTALLFRLNAGRIHVQRLSFVLSAWYTRLANDKHADMAPLRQSLAAHFPQLANELAALHAQRAEEFAASGELQQAFDDEEAKRLLVNSIRHQGFGI